MFYLSANIAAVGKREDAYFDSNTFATVPVTLKSYALLDVYAEYTFSKKRLKLFTELRNITNTKYNEIAGFNALRFNGYGGIRFTL
ncbi:MAG: TonB-dependent receptor [Chitinophagaceae bacterium]|nr:TonB-dependent receptor [Chitinophagaceae bacterium]